jgi:hypothetical protein
MLAELRTGRQPQWLCARPSAFLDQHVTGRQPALLDTAMSEVQGVGRRATLSCYRRQDKHCLYIVMTWLEHRGRCGVYGIMAHCLQQAYEHCPGPLSYV